MKEAPEKLKRDEISRIDAVKKSLEGDCVPGCNKVWLECAREILQFDEITELHYAQAIRENLIHSRGKFRNVILVGPSNGGKTFLLKPLKVIFNDRIFENPSNDKFGWVGADKASVILLQDFRWNRECITWKDLLLLLEGKPVKFLSPKNVYSEDILINTNVAIFATSKAQITYRSAYNMRDPLEDEMMRSRWNVIEFQHQFKEKDQKHLKPCGRCFAELILMTEDK